VERAGRRRKGLVHVCGLSRFEPTPERTAFTTHLWAGEGDTAAQALLLGHNAAIHRTRARIETIIGTCKRGSGLRRMRWRGLAKAAVKVNLTAIACNLTRAGNLKRAA